MGLISILLANSMFKLKLIRCGFFAFFLELSWDVRVVWVPVGQFMKLHKYKMSFWNVDVMKTLGLDDLVMI